MSKYKTATAATSKTFSQGEMIPRSSANIKNVKNTKTCWFFLWNQTAISKPRTLDPSATLELGDLFINQFHSKKHGGQVLQIWVLVKVEGSNDFLWKQVRD